MKKNILKNSNKVRNEQHPFHMVDNSVWPILTAFSLFSMAIAFIIYFHVCSFIGSILFKIHFLQFCFILFKWFSNIIIESTFEGNHTRKVRSGIRHGFLLFILSEIMFFFSFFWAFFHCSLSPAIGIGCVWPPLGIVPLDPWGLPLWNTVILLSSGVTITVAHRGIVAKSRYITICGLLSTIIFGFIFTVIQSYEYNIAPFSINDGIFGSLFFLLTGFHGIHVLVGSIFLIVCLCRHLLYHLTHKHHLGLECAIWYWHFVDVVWLFLFITLYIWGF